MEKSKAVVLFSGGQDSTVCLYWAMENFDEVYPLVINYGQKHVVEISSAIKIIQMAGLEDNAEFLRLPMNILKGGTLLNQESQASGSIADTWVPYRNMLFLTIALNRALVLGGESAVVTGVNAIDYSGYPDCREGFINSIFEAGIEASEKEIEIIAPLLFNSKSEIVKVGTKLEGCMEALAYSHTCYNGQVPPCGECNSCILRAKGFEEAGIKDPLIERLTNA